MNAFKLSLVVPHWPRMEGDDELVKRCIASIDADEKIVVVNFGMGMGAAINHGLRVSTGDYIIVSNNDCEWGNGDVRSMCDPDSITIPDNMQGQGEQPRSFYCMPRWVYEKVGGYDERFKVGYWEDDDMIRRWEEAQIPIKMLPVQVSHPHAGHTLNNHPDRQELFDANRKLFIEKWGR